MVKQDTWVVLQTQLRETGRLSRVHGLKKHNSYYRALLQHRAGGKVVLQREEEPVQI